MDALEKGCKPSPASGVAVNNRLRNALGHGLPNMTVDPSRLLVDGGVGNDMPNRMASDAIPADQQSIRETTADDSFEYKDNQELWQRVTSGPFLRHLNRHKIRVRTEHWVCYKNQDGVVEKKGQLHYLAKHQSYSCGWAIGMDALKRQKRSWRSGTWSLNHLCVTTSVSRGMNTQAHPGLVFTRV